MAVKKTWDKIKNLLTQWENSPATFLYYFISLLSIVALRVFLESFSDPVDLYWQILPAPAFIHYCLSFVMIFLAVTIVIKIFARADILKILRVQILFFPIIILPPLLDLIVSQGQGIDMAYLADKNFGELLRLFFTYFGPLEDSGITIGMRVEIVIVCILSAVYSYSRREKIFTALATAIFTYLACFLFVTMPSVIALVGNLSNNHTLLHNDNFFSFLYLTIILLELLLILYYYQRDKFFALVKNIRLGRLLHYEGMLLGGLWLGKMILGYGVALWQILAALLAVMLAWLSQVGLNDLVDVKIDQISNAQRPLIKKLFSVGEYRLVTFLSASLALLIAYMVAYHFLIFILIFMILYTIYSIPPLKLKRWPILATFIIASAALSLVMAGFSLPGHQYLVSFPSYLIGLVLISFTFSTTMKDIKDIAGDRAAGITTVPTLLGEKLGRKTVGVLVLLSYLIVPIIIPHFFITLLGFAWLFGIISYLFINKKTYQEKYVFLTYFGFLIILAYYLQKIYQ